jgi:hypothetical protein
VHCRFKSCLLYFYKLCGCDQVGKELDLRSSAKCLAGSSPAIRTKHRREWLSSKGNGFKIHPSKEVLRFKSAFPYLSINTKLRSHSPVSASGCYPDNGESHSWVRIPSSAFNRKASWQSGRLQWA